MNDFPDSSTGEAPFQVRLEGNSSPFDVMRDPRVAPLVLGEQAPPLEFEPPVEAGQTVVPDVVIVRPLSEVTRNPGFTAVAISDMICAGRIPDTSIDLVVFSVESPRGPEIGWFVFDGDLAIILAKASQEKAPGCHRSRVNPPERVTDVVIFGPLDREVAVVIMEIEDEVVGAVRPRARFAGFNTLGVSRSATVRLAAFDAGGGMIHEATIGPLLP